MISRFVLAALCCFLGACALLAEAKRPTGQNCDLAAPPEDAGEEADHGVLLFVFPRARDIGVNYNGCQTVWTKGQEGFFGPGLVSLDSEWPSGPRLV